MNLQIPWLISRRRKIIAIFIDFLINIFIFNFIFNLEFKSFPNKIVPISLAFFWISLSYILGRYSSEKLNGFGILIREIIKILSLLFFCNLIYLGINLTFPLIFHHGGLFYKYFSSNLSYLFFEITIYISITSFLIQKVFSLLTYKFVDKKSKWLFFGTDYNYEKLLEEIRKNDHNSKIIRFTDNEKMFSNFNSLSGIIIEDINTNFDPLIENIIKTNRIKIETLLSWYEKEFHKIPLSLIKNKNELLMRFSSFEENYQFRIKRLGDILTSLFLLIITLPITLIISLFIFLEDKGPILYSQIRTGLNGKRIKIFKFRSMRVNAEENGVQWSKTEDQRITKIGSFIRSTRLDELPQLFSVINGTMSLIGPRPERPEIEINLLSKIPYYKLRYKLRPGLSGWAQVNYPYGASVSDTEKKLSFDLYYISHFSFFLDILILFKTIKIVLNARGAKPTI